MNITEEINIGIDTGKHQLDIYIRPIGEYFTVENNEKGIKEAVKKIKKHHPTRVVIEATGRLEMPFACAASKAGLPIVIANCYHVHNFAVSTGKLAKTDKLDAAMIAHYPEYALFYLWLCYLVYNPTQDLSTTISVWLAEENPKSCPGCLHEKNDNYTEHDG